MNISVNEFSWPLRELGTAIETLARRAGLLQGSQHVAADAIDTVLCDPSALGPWVSATADWLGIEAEPADAIYEAVEDFVVGAGPALIAVPHDGELSFIAILRGNRQFISVLKPNLEIAKLTMHEIGRALCHGVEASFANDLDRLLQQASIPENRVTKARNGMVRERLCGRTVVSAWLLRCAPGTHLRQQLKQGRLPKNLIALAGVHVLEYFALLASWALIGRGALEGTLEFGWLLGWALLLFTMIPFRLLGTWLQGRLAIGSGMLLKQRLLWGALRLEPEEIRHQGIGQFLGQVIESQAIESLALAAGFQGVMAIVELITAAIVLSVFAHSVFEVGLLLLWTAVTFALGWYYFRSRRQWTTGRLGMTHDLTERMVGHRTRLAQLPPERWHEGEDQTLEPYLELSKRMDRAAVLLSAFIPRGWLILGLLGLTYNFVSFQGAASTLPVLIGGVILSFQALQKLSRGVASAADAAISWQQINPLFHAASRPQTFAPAEVAWRPKPCEDETRVLLDAHDLTFRYPNRDEAVLQSCRLTITSGERLLLEGSSGGGKSTLASVLTGMRNAQSGLLLLDGLDRATLGDSAWQRRIASAPQFHENHILSAPFAFNLLMGRQWPPTPQDLEAAEQVCRELGLGELLDRMPAGIMQMVGEMGWQLSHGERSRVFIARALLQLADMVILDESFAALDPETLRQCLQCVLSRASTLMVIAHP